MKNYLRKVKEKSFQIHKNQIYSKKQLFHFFNSKNLQNIKQL